jgi:hypothetical protein
MTHGVLLADWGLAHWAGLVLMAVIGLLALSVGGGLLVLRLMMRERCVGTVVDSWSNPDGGELPIVAFTTASGAKARFMGRPHIGRFGPKLGESAPVRYSATEVSAAGARLGTGPRVHQDLPLRAASIDTLRGSWSGPCGLIVFGIVMLGTVGYALDSSRSDRLANTNLRAEREAIYLSLGRSAIDVSRCARHSCSPRTTARRLRTYDRARRAAIASPATSSVVRERLHALEPSLMTNRQRNEVSSAVTGPIDALIAQLLSEVANDYELWRIAGGAAVPDVDRGAAVGEVGAEGVAQHVWSSTRGERRSSGSPASVA